jgi:hypothetical protein
MTTTTVPSTPRPEQQVPYPVHVDAELDPHLSRGLWLVKWLLAVPHYIVLVALWIAFAVATVLAFVSIVITGRYPRRLFDFNVGVMRWSWRVGFYSYSALGTDRYPPFTLADVPDYPAHLDVDYPEHLSRGLALVKWWLLAIPHYLVVGLFVGGIGYGARGADDSPLLSVSLVGVLVVVAAVVLLVTGRYPRSVFDLLLGLNRWVLRVAGYVSLMTDRYPPFRLDQGGHEPPAAAPAPDDLPPEGTRSLEAVRPAADGWTPGRVVSLVVGSLVVITGLTVAGAGATLAVVDHDRRDSDGFLMSPAERVATAGFAIASEDARVHTGDVPAWLPDAVLGDVRLEAASSNGADVFLGIARSEDAAAYLAGVRHDVLVEIDGNGAVYEETAGDPPGTAPVDASIWVVSAVGAEPEITWAVEDGSWTVVLMNTDGSARVAADLRVGAEIPALQTVVGSLLAAAALLLLLGAVLVAVPVRLAARTTGRRVADPSHPTDTEGPRT